MNGDKDLQHNDDDDDDVAMETARGDWPTASSARTGRQERTDLFYDKYPLFIWHNQIKTSFYGGRKELHY